ncbi:MAG TPA: phosphatase PAP2 family protein [Actinomycetes bacterium]|nr:phosphatase PAP2 family protein [Actinomycetes bacterium]
MHRAQEPFARRLPRLLTEPALFVAGVLAYFLTRGATEAAYPVAADHARRLVDLERGLGLDLERWAQGFVLPHEELVTLANWVYIYGHWPVIAAVGLWLVWRRPGTYRWLRTAMLVSGAIGVVVFVLYPVAPPRLMPELGVADTVTRHSSSYRVLQPPSLVNQYAALPSLHVGWDLLIGLALLRAATGRVLRALGVLAPVAMAVAVVVTGNHYLVDVVAGVLVALTGAVVATALERRSARRTAAPVAEAAVLSIVRQRVVTSHEEDDEENDSDDERQDGDGAGVHRSSDQSVGDSEEYVSSA